MTSVQFFGNVDDGANRDPTIADEVFVANKHNMAQISHIFIDDGGVILQVNYQYIPVPFTMLPAVPAVNDAIYFGIDTSLANDGPFHSLVFDIGSPAVYGGAAAMIWEYWNGAAWNGMTPTDRTDAGSGVFSQAGVNIVAVDDVVYTTWTTTAVNGVTGWWWRARVSNAGTGITPPTQQNRRVYSVVWPYVEIQDTEILGDITALGRIISGAEVDLGFGGDMIIGARSVSRGVDFTPYLNISDTQNHSDITVSLGAATAYATDPTAPTGRRATYTSVAADAISDRVEFEFGGELVNDYPGAYRALLRHSNASGNDDFTVRLRTKLGSDGLDTYTSTLTLNKNQAANNAPVLTDLGKITIPSTFYYDSIAIAVQLGHTVASVDDVYLWDLVLMPVDEWTVEVTPTDIAALLGPSEKHIIDTITDPKRGIVCFKTSDDSFAIVTDQLGVRTNSMNILQANSRIRLWFLAFGRTGSGTHISTTFDTHKKIMIGHLSRYLSMRGAR